MGEPGLNQMLLMGKPGLNQRPLVGKPPEGGFPWPEAAKGTRLQAHPFQRKGEAMFA